MASAADFRPLEVTAHGFQENATAAPLVRVEHSCPGCQMGAQNTQAGGLGVKGSSCVHRSCHARRTHQPPPRKWSLEFHEKMARCSCCALVPGCGEREHFGVAVQPGKLKASSPGTQDPAWGDPQQPHRNIRSLITVEAQRLPKVHTSFTRS